ncbi:MAG: hypothetical protein GY792_25515 [Gammaproteobacteria bacterium]|nr:hypothetical protein [Gammaproteobacteria bacterium]
MNNTQGDYTLIGTDLTGLWLQPGFVEGIVAERKRFATLVKAYGHIFRRNLEYAILLWNGLPIRFSYQDDLPAMVSNLIVMLHAVQHPEATFGTSYVFQTLNLQTLWQLEIDQKIVTIEGFWQQVPGHYEAALNQLGMIRMPRLAFLCEWKLLLQQFIQAIADAEAVLTRSEARNQLQTLYSLEANIPSRGRFYQHLDVSDGMRRSQRKQSYHEKTSN